MPLQAITATEPIPGYRIRERIGAGGYGEVWTADAPGGLVKAIKFVYGYLDEDRASRELKALNRIKSVRHPFLLSLERIEVVDGQLLIVTELAEASLKERFDEYRKEGKPGIPRDELLRFMRDAADVLDYMSQEHSLQHLDIKPENLLMLAGRVKVADFGLVKDIHDATASLMGGLTPLYAPPEVFDGRPSRWSDQYSLAIVYQEMLTGQLPFPGTTAVQLARQHLNARPRLSALPEHDQIVIARALSKAPSERFGSCGELVGELERNAAGELGVRDSSLGPVTGVRQSGSRPFPGAAGKREKSQTEVLDDVPEVQPWLHDSTAWPIPRVAESPETVSLDPIDLADVTAVAQPTLFLGVGRTAGRVLLQLRRRLEDRFGGLDNIPAFQSLLMDTDGKDLMEVSHHGGRCGMQVHETLGLPLRRPQDYRNESRQILRWLSRRWLYNIPRSLKTEGLRPLGRLAMVDHADQIVDRIQSSIQRASDPEAIEQSQRTTDLSFDPDAMRIILIASISGGTGSGMVVDLGYLARQILAELGYRDDAVYAVLTHSTGRSARSKELSIVNAYSTLTELNHYSRLGGGYPGDAACKLPPRMDDNVAFRDTYLIHLGDDLNEQQFDEAADKVAEYLYLDTATNATAFFQACRDAEPRHAETRNAEIRLRTFGLHQFSCLHDDIVAVAVEHLSHFAVERWLAGNEVPMDLPLQKRPSATVRRNTDATERPRYEHLAQMAEQFAGSLGLDVDHLIQQMFQHLESELGGPADEYFRNEIRQLPVADFDGSPQAAAAIAAKLREFLNLLLGPRHDPDDAPRAEPGTLESALGPFRQQTVLRLADAVRAWLFERVDDETARVRGAQWLAGWLGTHCKAAGERVGQVRSGIQVEITNLEQVLDTRKTSRGRQKETITRENLQQWLEQFCRLRLYEHVAGGVANVLQALKGQVSAIADEVMDLARELRHLTDQFDTSQTLEDVTTDDGVGAAELISSVTGVLVGGAEQLTAELEERLKTEVLVEAKGLRNLLTQGGNERNKLPAKLRAVARNTVVGMMKQLDVADVLFHDDGETEGEAKTVAECLEVARPSLSKCGGAQRLLVMLPHGSSVVKPLEILHRQMHVTPSVAENSDGDFVLCHEQEQISLTQVAVTLIEGRRDFAEFASRLHTRTDVEWSHLPDLV